MYNPLQLKNELLINYFQIKKIFKKMVNWPICGKQYIIYER